ncbi:hypothetical protein GYW75_02050 [Gilliamella sp. ESL0232]|uniref:hypothetical protein n=1 Tax=Gilliamella sp. ESL0232 TaxID=2705037 RepID=UPI001580BE14|nr:hypothetical protein [Gilliamella sp. ESL0232]NUE95174.1 hypothetical protein [Gilliamella sp. ESL0232]
MSLTKMIINSELNEVAANAVRQQFIVLAKKHNPNADFSVTNDSNLLNNFSNEDIRNQFSSFIAGALLNQSALAANAFGIIADEVHTALDSWDEERLGMANEMLFFINDLYIKYFGVGFMKIVEKKPSELNK